MTGKPQEPGAPCCAEDGAGATCGDNAAPAQSIREARKKVPIWWHRRPLSAAQRVDPVGARPASAADRQKKFLKICKISLDSPKRSCTFLYRKEVITPMAKKRKAAKAAKKSKKKAAKKKK